MIFLELISNSLNFIELSELLLNYFTAAKGGGVCNSSKPPGLYLSCAGGEAEIVLPPVFE